MPERQLAFPIVTLDDRINMREVIARLQRDPYHVRIVLTDRLERYWHYRVEFEGDPTDPEVLRLLRRHEPYVPPALTDPPYSFDTETVRHNDRFDPDVPRRILQNYLTESGEAMRRARLRQMAAPPIGPPLRRNIDYQSTGRRTFLVEELPGATPPQVQFDALAVPGASVEPAPDPLTFGAGEITHVLDTMRRRLSPLTPEQIRAGLAGTEPTPEPPPPPPPEPEPVRRSRFERLNDETFLADLAPKEGTGVISIDGKPLVKVSWVQSVKKFALNLIGKGTVIMMDHPKVEWSDAPRTRFERIDREE